MNEINELVAAAELGEEARKFMGSDLYKVMLGIAQQEVEAAREELESVPAHETTRILELQLKAKFGRAFEGWLNDLVEDGDNAIAVFRQQHSEAA